MATNDAEREELLSELRTLIAPVIVDRTASRMTLGELREHVKACRDQRALYESMGFVDEATLT